MLKLIQRNTDTGVEWEMLKKKNKLKIKGNVVLIALDSIEPNPNQPRKNFSDEQLDSLAKSISRNGLLTPIIVVKNKDRRGFTLVAGERRLRACQKLGMSEIPCIIENYSSDESAVLALVENMHREDLNYFEQAEGIEKLINSLGMTQSKVCAMLGISQPSASNKMRLLKLSDEIKQLAIENDFPERVARGLLKIDDEEKRLNAAIVIAEKKYNTQKAEEYIEGLVEQQENSKIHRNFISHDYRIIFSSVEEIVKEIKNRGVNLVTQRTENDKFYLYTIKVHKNV